MPRDRLIRAASAGVSLCCRLYRAVQPQAAQAPQIAQPAHEVVASLI